MVKFISPCLTLNCIRKNKNKDTYTCKNCKPRSDFTLASMGDVDAAKRFMAFEYQDVGKWCDEPPLKQLTKKELLIRHYENYFFKYDKEINEKYNKNFTTMREIVGFLYYKYKVQSYITKEILFISRQIFINMLNVFEIERIDRKEVMKEFQKKKRYR